MSQAIPCRHCGVKAACRPRGLCWTCYEDRASRSLYATDPRFSAKGDSNKPLLPVLRVYPDPGACPLCIHGRHDGECPECEREQRAKIVFSVEEEVEA